MVVAAVRGEGVVVVAHRRSESRCDRFLADAEVRRPADEALEEELLSAGLELATLDHRPVHGQPERDVGRHDRRHQYAFATNSSCDGNRVMTCGPFAVTTTSSSIRAAE
jgi:hypothetical protein